MSNDVDPWECLASLEDSDLSNIKSEIEEFDVALAEFVSLKQEVYDLEDNLDREL